MQSPQCSVLPQSYGALSPIHSNEYFRQVNIERVIPDASLRPRLHLGMRDAAWWPVAMRDGWMRRCVSRQRGQTTLPRLSSVAFRSSRCYALSVRANKIQNQVRESKNLPCGKDGDDNNLLSNLYFVLNRYILHCRLEKEINLWVE